MPHTLERERTERLSTPGSVAREARDIALDVREQAMPDEFEELERTRDTIDTLSDPDPDADERVQLLQQRLTSILPQLIAEAPKQAWTQQAISEYLATKLIEEANDFVAPPAVSETKNWLQRATGASKKALRWAFGNETLGFAKNLKDVKLPEVNSTAKLAVALNVVSRFVSRRLNSLKTKAGVRMAVGYGLVAGAGISMATGNVPLSALLLGARASMAGAGTYLASEGAMTAGAIQKHTRTERKVTWKDRLTAMFLDPSHLAKSADEVTNTKDSREGWAGYAFGETVQTIGAAGGKIDGSLAHQNALTSIAQAEAERRAGDLWQLLQARGNADFTLRAYSDEQIIAAHAQSVTTALAERLQSGQADAAIQHNKRHATAAAVGVAGGVFAHSLPALKRSLSDLAGEFMGQVADRFTPTTLEAQVSTPPEQWTDFRLNHVASECSTPGVEHVAAVGGPFGDWESLGIDPAGHEPQPVLGQFAQAGEIPSLEDGGTTGLGDPADEPTVPAEDYLAKANFRTDVPKIGELQTKNFTVFHEQIFPDLENIFTSAQSDPAQASAILKIFEQDWNLNATEANIPIERLDGATIFKGYKLGAVLGNGQTLGQHLVANAAELEKNPVAVYQLLSHPHPETIPVLADGVLDIEAGYQAHVDALVAQVETAAVDATQTESTFTVTYHDPEPAVDGAQTPAEVSSSFTVHYADPTPEPVVSAAAESDFTVTYGPDMDTPGTGLVSSRWVEVSSDGTTGDAAVVDQAAVVPEVAEVTAPAEAAPSDGPAAGTSSEVLRGDSSEVKEASVRYDIATPNDLTQDHLKLIREKIASASFASQVSNTGDLDAVQLAARDLALRGEAIEVTKVIQTDTGLQVETELAGSVVKLRVKDLETGTITGASITPDLSTPGVDTKPVVQVVPSTPGVGSYPTEPEAPAPVPAPVEVAPVPQDAWPELDPEEFDAIPRRAPIEAQPEVPASVEPPVTPAEPVDDAPIPRREPSVPTNVDATDDAAIPHRDDAGIAAEPKDEAVIPRR